MTYHFGLIGYPIGHSLSPWIHREFLERTHLEGEYELIEILPEDDFDTRMANLKKRNLDGFNITVPYKEKILDYLDDIDDYAKQIGAVNTVLCKNGQWIGYNTDGIGFVRSLESKFPGLKIDKTRKILILGAGGAAKGIYHALLKNGYNDITIANRTINHAVNIVGDRHPVITLIEAEQQIKEFNLFIQTTSVGMKPHTEQSILNVTALDETAIVSDIVYQPLMTKLLKDAKSSRASIHFGHTMLLYQAQYAFEIWTNKQPNMDEIDTQLQVVLEG